MRFRFLTFFRGVSMARILLATTEFVPITGGVATYTRELAAAASAIGHEPLVLAPDYRGARGLAEYQDRDLPFEVVRFRANETSYTTYPAYFLQCLRWAILRDWDVVHAVDLPFIEILSALRFISKTKLYSTLHGSDILRSKVTLKGRLLSPLKIFGKSERIFTNSAFTRDLLLKNYSWIEPRRVRVTHLGVNEFWLGRTTRPSAAREPDIRQQYGLDPDRNILITVARLSPRKGQDIVVQALSLLPEEVRATIQYVCVGRSTALDPTYADTLRALANESAVPVHVLGEISDPDVRALYGESHVACMPGRPHEKSVEGFGLAYLEAGACGVPAVASRMGGIPEAVLDGKTGLLVEPENVAELAEAIASLFRDDDLRKRLAQAAQKWAQENTWRRCAELTYAEVQ